MCHFNSLAAARLRSPAEFLLLGRCPELALFLEMDALLELLLSGFTAENGVAVLIDAVAEVLTSHANTGSFPALKLPLIDAPTCSTAVLYLAP